MTTAIIGTILVAGYVALAWVQITVLNPLAAVPGRTLDQIYADLAVANQGVSVEIIVFCLAPGPILAVAVLILTLVRPGAGPVTTAAMYLAILACGAFGSFAASFGTGMSLADTYGIGGGDYAPWGRLLQSVSAVSALMLTVILVAAPIRERRRRRAGGIRATV